MYFQLLSFTGFDVCLLYCHSKISVVQSNGPIPSIPSAYHRFNRDFLSLLVYFQPNKTRRKPREGNVTVRIGEENTRTSKQLPRPTL
jgi:hypothetical protein